MRHRGYLRLEDWSELPQCCVRLAVNWAEALEPDWREWAYRGTCDDPRHIIDSTWTFHRMHDPEQLREEHVERVKLLAEKRGYSA